MKQNSNNNIELTEDNMTLIFNNAIPNNITSTLNKDEQTMLYLLLKELKHKPNEKVIIPFNSIKGYDKNNEESMISIINTVNSLWNKIKMVDYTLYSYSGKKVRSAGGIILFSYLSINQKEQVIKLKLNSDLKDFINRFDKQHFMSLQLKEFKEQPNKYGQALFRLLENNAETGNFTIKKDELMDLLKTPKSYRNNFFNSRVLMPAVKVNKAFFDDLKIDKIKSGRKILSYKFSFTPKYE